MNDYTPIWRRLLGVAVGGGTMGALLLCIDTYPPHGLLLSVGYLLWFGVGVGLIMTSAGIRPPFQ